MGHRKRWEDLSPDYRKRLERNGITEAKHASGAGLAKARGKKSANYERHQSRLRKFAKIYADTYHGFAPAEHAKSRQEVLQVLRAMPQKQAQNVMRRQAEALEAYLRGDSAKGRRLWNRRNKRLPDWLYYYHGAFS
jgi:hypothetical protein